MTGRSSPAGARAASACGILRDGQLVGQWNSPGASISSFATSLDRTSCALESGGILYAGRLEETGLEGLTPVSRSTILPSWMVLSRDGSILAFAEVAVPGIKAIDTARGAVKWHWQHRQVHCLASSPRDGYLAAADREGTVWLGTVERGDLTPFSSRSRRHSLSHVFLRRNPAGSGQ